MADSDCVVVMGSNMAECHPVAFRWPMLAKARGAKLIHVDPRFTRTSAMADIHAAIRAGSDMAFLGGLVTYVINSRRWNTDPFFKSFVVNYTNAATIVSAEYKDTEDLDGVFSGLKEFQEKIKEWPLNAFLGQYDNKTWQYAAPGEAGAGWKAPTQQSGEHKAAEDYGVWAKYIVSHNRGNQEAILITGPANDYLSQVATNEFRGGGGGERTEYHNVIAWDRLAEICGQFLSKGQLVDIEGRLQTRQWDDDAGIRHWKTEVVSAGLEMLSGRGKKEYAKEVQSAAADEADAAAPTDGQGEVADEELAVAM